MINFTPDLATKHPLIDKQHKELFKRLNDVLALGGKATTSEETEKTFKLLGDYIKEHFSDEEELQQRFSFPKYEWHRDQHNLYIDSFVKLKEEYDRNGASAEFSNHLNKSIIDWIINHIRVADVELGKFLNGKR